MRAEITPTEACRRKPATAIAVMVQLGPAINLREGRKASALISGITRGTWGLSLNAALSSITQTPRFARRGASRWEISSELTKKTKAQEASSFSLIAGACRVFPRKRTVFWDFPEEKA